jgi:L-2,4-diaminobutyrate decarboxylase
VTSTDFRARGHAFIDALADFLDEDGPVFPLRDPEAALARYTLAREEPAALLARVLRDSIKLHSPRYVGHQVTPPAPSAALWDLASGLLNNGMGVFEMGAAGVAIEQAVIRWMARKLGLPDGADGIFTHGGSMGNLTALLAMREAKCRSWDAGSRELPAVLVAETAHYSIKRAVQIMGWGAGGAIPVPVDARFRLRPDVLSMAHDRRVIGVVASAASTGTGAYDPIPPIADFCARHDLWLHVDGAHGASAAVSTRYRHLVDGIGRADSVVWDAHKMLNVPALATAVLYRDTASSLLPFREEAAYLFHGDARWDLGHRTLECTKRMISLALYATLAERGEEALDAYVTDKYDQARRFAARLRDAGFEVIEPDANIVCFRPRSGDVPRLREKLLDRFYVVQTTIAGAPWLRATIINPATTDDDLAELITACSGAR